MSDPFRPGLLARLPEPPRRVVLVRSSRIGDFILATPAIRALKAAMPEAEFTFIGLPFLRDLAERSPHIEHYVEFPGYPGMAEQFFDARKLVRFFADMQARAFDLAVQLNGSGVYSNPFTLMLGARYTAGWIRQNDPPGRLDAALPWPETGHEIDRVLSLPLFLGAPLDGRQTEFPLLERDRAEADKMLAGAAQPLIGFHPAARESTKRWPTARYAVLSYELQRRYGGTIVIVGGPDERELAAEVVTGFQRIAGPRGPLLNLAGQTTLGSLGAAVSRFQVFITNDSGPAHIAYALDTPTVTVFGATNPARWGPPSAPYFRVIVNAIECWPCDYWVCPIGNQCLEGIPIETVFEAAEAVMAARSAEYRAQAPGA